jgi:hypothetical protein
MTAALFISCCAKSRGEIASKIRAGRILRMEGLLAVGRLGFMERRASGIQIINPNSWCGKINFRGMPNAVRAMSTNIGQARSRDLSAFLTDFPMAGEVVHY